MGTRCCYDFVVIPAQVAGIEPTSFATGFGPSRRGKWVELSPADLAIFNDLGIDVAQTSTLIMDFCADWEFSLERYFNTIHKVGPAPRQARALLTGSSKRFHAVSRRKIEQMLSVATDRLGSNQMRNPAVPYLPKPVAVLFFTCICLLVEGMDSLNTETDSKATGYQISRRMFALLAYRPDPGIEILQCGAMLALFEFGHGDLLTAYQTLTQTVTIARLSGFGNDEAIEPWHRVTEGGVTATTMVIMTIASASGGACLFLISS